MKIIKINSIRKYKNPMQLVESVEMPIKLENNLKIIDLIKNIFKKWIALIKSIIFKYIFN
mgnify:CR=1 FL=1